MFRSILRKIPGLRNFMKAPEKLSSGGWQLRPLDGQGAFTSFFKAWVPRKVEAQFYEFLREAIPIIDAAIMRLVSLDGHIIVKGKNADLVEEIQDWIDNVKVNDVQRGLQAFHQSLTNEAFEQGFGLGEFIPDKKRTDIVGLKVADSKSIKFSRVAGGGLGIYQKADGDRDDRELNQENLMYFSINNENQNPYGTALMRSCEFVAQTLVTIQNATKNVWERFGDPSFEIVYKTSKKDGTDHEARRQAIETDFNTAIRAKREGKSADFIRAIDTNSEISIKVIGSDGQELQMETPARHMLEQIIAKTGLPPWMLGMHWSTSERLSSAELAVLRADIATRQAAKLPLFTRLVKTLLLLRGRSWKRGDWWLEWGQVNLQDVVQLAQARFLNGQADMYYMQNAEAAGITLDIDDLALGKALGPETRARLKKGPKSTLISINPKGLEKSLEDHMMEHLKDLQRYCGHKELQRSEPWPALDKVEADYEKRLKEDWKELHKKVAAILGFGVVKAVKGDAPFTFSIEQRALVMSSLKDFVGEYSPDNPDSPVTWYYGQAFSLGVLQAAMLIGAERPVLDLLAGGEIFGELQREGFNLVKDNATKAITNKILSEMEAYVITGSNPNEVAARLEKLFGDANKNWERLARSEMNMAAETAKLAEWNINGVAMVEFSPAPDACSICTALAGDYEIDKAPIPVRNTHPRCRCSNIPAKSETVA